MSHSKSLRILLGSALVVALLAISAASAAAAGPPTAGTPEATFSATGAGVNWVEMVGTANPNGASTTATFEYRQVGTSTWEVGPSVSAGSGTTSVPVQAKVPGQKPKTRYEFRITASNSYGSSTSAAYEAPFVNKWSIISEGKGQVSTFTSEGIATFAWDESGYKAKIECTEAGSGTLGNAEGLGDSYSVHLTKCGYYLNGTPYCNTSPIDLTFNGSFKSTVESVNVLLCPNDLAYNVLHFTAPFVGPATPENTAALTTSHSYTLTGPMTLNAGKAVSATISSKWQLSGALSGLRFGVLIYW